MLCLRQNTLSKLELLINSLRAQRMGSDEAQITGSELFCLEDVLDATSHVKEIMHRLQLDALPVISLTNEELEHDNPFFNIEVMKQCLYLQTLVSRLRYLLLLPTTLIEVLAKEAHAFCRSFLGKHDPVAILLDTARLHGRFPQTTQTSRI